MSQDIKLSPIPDHDWPDQIVDMLTGFAGGLNVYRTMAHHPALLRAWSGLREHIVNQSTLGRRRVELVILRTGFRMGSDYEWGQHVLRARKLGIEDERIAFMRGPADKMDPEAAILAQAVDALMENRKLGDDDITAVTELVGKEGVFDLIATVGFYSTLGFILNSFETPLDEDIAAELAANPLGGAVSDT